MRRNGTPRTRGAGRTGQDGDARFMWATKRKLGCGNNTKRWLSPLDADHVPDTAQISGGLNMANVTTNGTQGQNPARYNYPALLLGVALILVIILGNVLVCLSVLTERSLKTATNYFIVSLAVADLLLAVLVLPLYVYSEFLGGIWTLNMYICDALMTMDVMLCTASILNLCAISVDRYIAVVVPLKYNRNQFSMRQLILITATWVLSFGVASPVIFGLNQVPGRDASVCKLENDSFVVYSSVCSFFVPCPIMLLLYYWMFRGLRRWGASRESNLLQAERRFSLGLRGLRHERKTGVSYLVPGLSPTEACPGPVPDSDLITTQGDSASDAEGGERAREGSPRVNGLRGHGSGKVSSSKSSRVSGRERKAMKVLPVVVGVFLACWTPFFVVHVTKVLCVSCNIKPTLISVVTWLGYVNSAVNPIIYTAFNAEFRNVFQKLLCCQT
ncbi:D(4) dopamine receptor-like [Arapaima gigas]